MTGLNEKEIKIQIPTVILEAKKNNMYSNIIIIFEYILFFIKRKSDTTITYLVLFPIFL